MTQPPGIVTAHIDPNTGQVLNANANYGVSEYFRNDTVPSSSGETSSSVNNYQGNAMNDSEWSAVVLIFLKGL